MRKREGGKKEEGRREGEREGKRGKRRGKRKQSYYPACILRIGIFALCPCLV